jgi:hypothetical protein
MWITTNTDVACRVEITDKQLNVTRTYSLLEAFLTFPAITVDNWRKMRMPPRMERINAFKEYINDLEVIDIDAIQTNDVFRQSGATPGIPPLAWILADGVWNDNGAWYDDASWKDTA